MAEWRIQLSLEESDGDIPQSHCLSAWSGPQWAGVSTMSLPHKANVTLSAKWAPCFLKKKIWNGSFIESRSELHILELFLLWHISRYSAKRFPLAGNGWPVCVRESCSPLPHSCGSLTFQILLRFYLKKYFLFFFCFVYGLAVCCWSPMSSTPRSVQEPWFHPAHRDQH